MTYWGYVINHYFKAYIIIKNFSHLQTFILTGIISFDYIYLQLFCIK